MAGFACSDRVVCFVRVLALASLIGIYHLLWANEPGLVIRQVTVISPHDIGAQHVRDVLIQGQRIARIEAALDLAALANVRIVDGKHKFLIPGLIDGHVNLGRVPGMNVSMMAGQPKLEASYRAQVLRSFLYYGFTTLVDMDPSSAVSFSKTPSQEPRPRLFRCGVLPIYNGYPMAYVGAELYSQLFPVFIWPTGFEMSSQGFRYRDHLPRKAVADIKAHGVNCTLVYAHKGNAQMPLASWDAELMTSIRRETRRSRLSVWAELGQIKELADILPLAPDLIGGAVGLWGDQDFHPGIPKEVRDSLDQLLSRKILLMPNVRETECIGDLFNPTFLNAPLYTSVMPKDLIRWYRSREGQWYLRALVAEDSRKKNITWTIEGFRRLVLQGERALKYFADFNGRLVFGSYTGVSPSAACAPGYSVYLAILAMQRAGVSLDAVFKSLTLDNARQLQIDKDYGSIEVNKYADLILLNANPLENAQAYNDIAGVVLQGRYFRRSGFAASN